MEAFRKQANKGQQLEKSLYAYVDNIRSSNMNLQAVMDQQVKAADPPKYVNNNIKAKVASSTDVKPTSNTCHICHSSHPGIRFYDCPKLEAVQRRRDTLDDSICPRCLKTLGNKTCTQGKCDTIGRFVVSCAVHPGPEARHFKVCTKCPPGKTVSPFPAQRVTQSMGVTVQQVQVANQQEIAPKLANVAKTGEVRLRKLLYLVEIIKILSKDGTTHRAVVLYDSAGGLSLVQTGLAYLDNFLTTHYSENLKVDTLVGSETARYPVRNLNLISEASSPNGKQPVSVISLLLHERNFPLTSPAPVLGTLRVRVKGERSCQVPSVAEVKQLPAIVLGTHDIAYHPSLLPLSAIPAHIQKQHPGLRAFKSALTGRVILGGSIAETSHNGSSVVSLQSTSTHIQICPEEAEGEGGAEGEGEGEGEEEKEQEKEKVKELRVQGLSWEILFRFPKIASPHLCWFQNPALPRSLKFLC